MGLLFALCTRCEPNKERFLHQLNFSGIGKSTTIESHRIGLTYQEKGAEDVATVKEWFSNDCLREKKRFVSKLLIQIEGDIIFEYICM